MGRGGPREGSGATKGGGEWKGLDTKPIRLPTNCANDVKETVKQLLFNDSEQRLNLEQLASTLRNKLISPMTIRSKETFEPAPRIPEFWGKVAATPGVSSFDNATIGDLDIYEYLVSNPEKMLAFRVTGDSMVDAGIHDNALLLIELLVDYPFSQPEHNDIIIAEVNDEIVVKRFDKRQGKTFLVSENKAKNYKPILIKNSTPFRPIGIVKSSILRF